MSNKIYLLSDADSPKTGSKKALRRSNLEELSKERENFYYQRTKSVEIENLLPMSMIKGFMKNLVDKKHQDKLESIYFTRKEYFDIRLGKFYRETLKKNKIPYCDNKSFFEKSGTLKNDYKQKLCREFLATDFSYEKLVEQNPELDRIIKNLYNFLKKKKRFKQ